MEELLEAVRNLTVAVEKLMASEQKEVKPKKEKKPKTEEAEKPKKEKKVSDQNLPRMSPKLAEQLEKIVEGAGLVYDKKKNNDGFRTYVNAMDSDTYGDKTVELHMENYTKSLSTKPSNAAGGGPKPAPIAAADTESEED